MTILAVLQQVSLLTTSKVAVGTSLAKDVTTTSNESVTISVTNSETSTNSTTLALDGYITDSETVRNASNNYTLVRGVDYIITLLGGAASGGLTTEANLTLLNVSHFCDGDTCPNGAAGDTNTTGFNNTELKITYDHNDKSKYELTLF